MGRQRHRVFSGVKVADFSWVGVGPMTTRLFADYGATVVRVESGRRPDPLKLMPPFKDRVPGPDRAVFGAFAGANKYSLALDLNHPTGQAIGTKLIEWADIVGESYRPGQMKKWGLDYASARRVNERVIYFSASLQGQTGPHGEFIGYGMHTGALAGLYHMTGWPDLEPVGPYGAYVDYIAWPFLQAAVLAALDYRRRTGVGQYIDLSQFETAMHFVGPQVLDYRVNHREAIRMGNRDPAACPHGVYRCRGEDEWIAISVETEGEWREFCAAAGRGQWLNDPRLASAAERKRHEAELDRLVEEWTSGSTAREAMALLQARGISAGVVQKVSELFSDPQLAERGWMATLEHGVIGRHSYETHASMLSRTPYHMERPAPLLGQDNEFVLRDILGLSAEEIEAVARSGALQ